jgi:hypothetical protein
MTTDHFCLYLQNRLIQTGQTGGQLYSDTSPFSVPWSRVLVHLQPQAQGEKMMKRAKSNVDKIFLVY